MKNLYTLLSRKTDLPFLRLELFKKIAKSAKCGDPTFSFVSLYLFTVSEMSTLTLKWQIGIFFQIGKNYFDIMIISYL